jgi:hypothetical protein
MKKSILIVISIFLSTGVFAMHDDVDDVDDVCYEGQWISKSLRWSLKKADASDHWSDMYSWSENDAKARIAKNMERYGTECKPKKTSQKEQVVKKKENNYSLLENKVLWFNSQLPIMLDEITRLDSTELVGMDFQVNYSLLKNSHEFNANFVKKFVTPNLKRDLCYDPLWSWSKGIGTKIRYVYSTFDINNFVEIVLDPNDC